ncbi:3072_t:CDS:2, partial [Entrophospora sp. SA101]
MSDYFLSHEEEVLETDQGYIIKLRLLSKRFFTKQSAEFPENYKFTFTLNEFPWQPVESYSSKRFMKDLAILIMSNNMKDKKKEFIFQYDPQALPKRMFDRFEEAIRTGKKHIQPKNVMIANRLETIYRVASQVRMDLLACLVEKQPANIQELAQLLNRDYANVWRDCQALNSLGIIKLKKVSLDAKKAQIQPIALYEKIIIEFPIKPSLIREWKSQVDQTIKIIEPSQTIDFLKKENEKLRNRELNANEKKMVAFRSTIPDSGDLNMRMEAANRMLTELEENDLSTQANPNLAAEGLYSRETNELNQQITELEKRIEELNSTILLPNQSHDFSTLQTEIKRLKIQDLTIQIPLKKQELEQLINNLKSELSEAGKYLLD